MTQLLIYCYDFKTVFNSFFNFEEKTKHIKKILNQAHLVWWDLFIIWNPLTFKKKPIVLQIQKFHEVLFFESVSLFLVLMWVVVGFVKKTFLKKTLIFILSWCLAYVWLAFYYLSATANTTMPSIHASLSFSKYSSSNNYLSWCAGILFLTLPIFFSLSYNLQYQAQTVKERYMFNFFTFVILYLLAYFQAICSSFCLRMLYFDLYLLIVLGVLNKSGKKVGLVNWWLNFEPTNITCWTYLTLLTYDVTSITSNFHYNWIFYIANVAVSLYLIRWFVYIFNICLRGKAIFAMYVICLIWPLLLSIILFYCEQNNFYLTKILILILCAFWALVIITQVLGMHYQSVERHRRITMFSEAPVMELPKTFFDYPPQQLNVFLLNVLNAWSMYMIFLIVVLCTSFNTTCFLLLLNLLTITHLCLFLVSYYISVPLKSTNLTDWRGLYLASHEHNWAYKLVSVALCFLWLLLAFFFFCSFCLTPWNKPINFYVIIGVILVITALFVTFSYILYIWFYNLANEEFIPTYDWTNRFWTLLSPHLRDFVYWRPVHGDDYKIPLPFYAGFKFKKTIYRVFYINILFSFIFLIATIQSSFNQYPVNLFLFFPIFFFYLTFLAAELFRNSFVQDNKYLRQYTYLETHAQLVGLGATCFFLWFITTQTEWGLFTLLYYWRLNFQ